MTRGGWSNTAGQQRSTLQRVSYGLVDDAGQLELKRATLGTAGRLGVYDYQP